MEFGTKIAQLRMEHNMTQEELASRLFVSRDLISKWENNKRRPDHEILKEISSIFSVETDIFESDEEAMIRELSKFVPKGTDMSDEDLLKCVTEFLRTLPERYRNVFVRRYYFLETMTQIGERYLMRPGHIRIILLRTRSKFCKYLMERKDQYER